MKKDFWDNSRTPVRFPRSSFELTSRHRVGFFGSCFASELEEKYRILGLNSTLSPFGISYNPLSLAESFTNLSDNTIGGTPFYQQGLWRHFSFHSSRCYKGEPSEGERAESHFRDLVARGHEEMGQTDFLVLTLGTAWVYRHLSSSRIVNNCHRCDNRDFERDSYLKWDNPSSGGSLGISLDRLKTYNDKLHVIITVSPVRHLRNDARENSYSKALLRCLCEDICRNRDWIEYFPAYEIVMDELRDYRWYGDDLCHPSPRAVHYILERFFEWIGGEELLSHIADRENTIRRENHRSLS